MKIKVDENLPLQIAVELRTRTHNVQTEGEEGFSVFPCQLLLTSPLNRSFRKRETFVQPDCTIEVLSVLTSGAFVDGSCNQGAQIGA